MNVQTETLVAYLEDATSENFMTASIFDNLAYYQNIDTNEKLDGFTGSIYNWFIRECVQRNQYLVFPDDTYENIFALYKVLVLNLKRLAREATTKETVRSIVREHRRHLIELVRPVEKTVPKSCVILPCAEYTEETQLEILGLDIASITEPFLDIGCGERATLVDAVRRAGKQAVGIDQYQPSANGECVIRANWLEFDYREAYWGTIVSHMAFSNHFIRATKTDPELAAWYQAVYMEILDSLKSGGIFCYTPALPRAEAFLDRRYFRIEHTTNVAGSPELDTVRVTRL